MGWDGGGGGVRGVVRVRAGVDVVGMGGWIGGGGWGYKLCVCLHAPCGTCYSQRCKLYIKCRQCGRTKLVCCNCDFPAQINFQCTSFIHDVFINGLGHPYKCTTCASSQCVQQAPGAQLVAGMYSWPEPCIFLHRK